MRRFTNQEKTSKASLSKGPPGRLKFPGVHSGFFLLPPSRVRFSHSRITNYNCGLSWNVELNHVVYWPAESLVHSIILSAAICKNKQTTMPLVRTPVQKTVVQPCQLVLGPWKNWQKVHSGLGCSCFCSSLHCNQEVKRMNQLLLDWDRKSVV